MSPSKNDVLRDENLMAEEIGRLRVENRDLQSRLSKTVDELAKEKYYSIAGVTFVVGPILCVFGTLLLRAIFCKGDITHCYVDTPSGNQEVLGLYGNIDGWPDDTLGRFKTASEAVKEAQAIGCPMWRRAK